MTTFETAREPSLREMGHRDMPEPTTWERKAFKLDRIDAVVKVGGSVVWSERCDHVREGIAALARQMRLLVVPGGGATDRVIEAEHERAPLDRVVFHRMTALAQDQTGLLLSNTSKDLVPVTSVRTAEEEISRGKVPVLLPSAWLETTDIFRYTNRVSSDSIALFIASTLRVPRLVLVKSRLPERSGNDLAAIAAETGYVDEVFVDLARSTGVRVTCVSANAAVPFEGVAPR
jgi:hypothetical protein